MKTFIQPLFTALTLSSILIAAPSQAQPKDPEIDCKNAKTQLEMNLCAAQSFKVADTELNQIYRQLRTHYKGTKQAPQFLNAQLAWLKFRDADCQFSADRFKGGSIAPLIYSSCQENLTKQRTESLKKYLEMT